MSLFSAILGVANARFLKKFVPLVQKINGLEPEFEKLSDDELRSKTVGLKKILNENSSRQNHSTRTVLVEAFALVRESAKRTLGQRHFDVQLLGGMVLHQGRIAEMRTGEGKTLVATLPAYLNALAAPPAGGGVHIVTVNDYLARRDAVWMGQIYDALGLKVGCINHEASFLYDAKHTEKLYEKRDSEGSFKIVHEYLRPCSRKEAYEADITYGTNNEFGFDYLRDNLAYLPEQMSQRGHNFAIIDEVDSILIDEARTPLIISAPDAESGKLYETFARVVDGLQENRDHTIDKKKRASAINHEGITR